MTGRLFLAFAGATYYNNTPGDLLGTRGSLEEAMALAKAKHEENLVTWVSPDYCWYCVVEVDLATLQHKTVFDSREAA